MAGQKPAHVGKHPKERHARSDGLPTLGARRHRRGGARLSVAVGVPALEGHSGARGEGLKAASALQGVGHLRQGLLDRGLHLSIHRARTQRTKSRRPTTLLALQHSYHIWPQAF